MSFSPIGVGAAVEAAVDKAAVTLASKLPDAWEVTRVGGSLEPASGYVPAPTAFRPLKPYISWPGVGSNIVSCSYSNSHSIAPGCAVLTINPQRNQPDVFGTLAFGDSIRPPIRLRDCHLDKMIANTSGAGTFIDLYISDRRWRWQQGHMIHGEYNRYDEHGNLVPWSVQSAKELAILCLKAMGEKRYVIAFPPGLTHAQAIGKYDRYLRAGERFPLTYANPYVMWDHIPAAIALQRLADLFGCRVMYDPISDKVGVLPVGYGAFLPYGGTSVASASQSIEASRIPRRIGVLGAPIKFQGRLPLEGVGEDWDTYYMPLKALTYAPILTAATASAEAKRGWDYCPPPEFPMVEATDRLEYTEAKEFAARSIFRTYRILRGVTEKYGRLLTAYGLGTDTFDYNKGFASSTWDKMVDGPTGGVGDAEQYAGTTLDRRQQFILTNFKVEQNRPRNRRDADVVVEPNRPNAINDPGSLPDYYNGYSRDRPAECFGTYFVGCSQVWYNLTGTDIVTKRRVYLPFDVNPKEQLVVFGEHLYTLGGSGADRTYLPAADLFVETGVNILHSETNAIIRPKFWLELGGEAPDVWETHEDVIVHLVVDYPDANSLIGKGSHIDDFGDGKARAQYYLQGLKRRYQNWQTQTVRYNGCMLVPPSGTIQQIHWSLSANGIYTTASANSEFLPTIPPYPVRKLQENLPPNEAAKVLNVVSNPFTAKRVMIENLPLYKGGS